MLILIIHLHVADYRSIFTLNKIEFGKVGRSPSTKIKSEMVEEVWIKSLCKYISQLLPCVDYKDLDHTIVYMNHEVMVL